MKFKTDSIIAVATERMFVPDYEKRPIFKFLTGDVEAPNFENLCASYLNRTISALKELDVTILTWRLMQTNDNEWAERRLISHWLEKEKARLGLSEMCDIAPIPTNASEYVGIGEWKAFLESRPSLQRKFENRHRFTF